MSTTNLQRLFEHFDFNGDGSMDFGELQVLFQVLGHLEPSIKVDQAIAQKYFDYADQNKDRKLSYPEFLRVVTQSLYASDKTYRDLKQKFYSYDLDANERLSKNEFAVFMKDVYSYMNDPRFQYKDSVMDFFFSQIDKDANGTISFDEYYLYVNGALKRD